MSNIYVLLDDKKIHSGARTYDKVDEPLFKKMNEEGWGIYFAVNSFEGNVRQKINHGIS